jgi:hypothetical protein
MVLNGTVATDRLDMSIINMLTPSELRANWLIGSPLNVASLVITLGIFDNPNNGSLDKCVAACHACLHVAI